MARLRQAGFTIHAHDDCKEFRQKTKDVEFIPVVSARRWIILTGDKNQAKDVLEIECHMRSRSRTFISGGRMTSSEYCDALLQNRNRILQYIARAEKRRTEPYIVRVSRPDKTKLDNPCSLTLWMDEEKWAQLKAKKGIQ